MDAASVSWDNVLDSSSVSVDLSRGKFKRDFWLTYIIIIMFGIGSWIAVNGVFVELPVLVHHAPEGLFLSSYLTIICQVANIGPVLFVLGRALCPRIIHEKTTIYVIVIIGIGACMALSFLWNKTSYFLGKERSTTLMLFTFAVALVDCTSTVTFLPFMVIFPPVFLSALYTGENMSGLLPGLIALAQGADKYRPNVNSTESGTKQIPVSSSQLNFSPGWFFAFLCLMMVICFVAFLSINHLQIVKRQQVIKYSDILAAARDRRNINRYGSSSSESSLLVPGVEVENRDVTETLTKWQCIYLLSIQVWINALSNGILTQIQPFACEPYGSSVYHVAATLSSVAAAITCFIFTWLSTKSRLVISILSLFYSLCGLYIIIIALQSPRPVLLHQTIGNILVIVISIFGSACVNYAKLAICLVMRCCGKKHLFWCGVAIQIGSLTGAVLTFPIVNYTTLFKS